MNEKIKIGVFGGFRGMGVIDYCLNSDDVILKAVCDRKESILEDVKKKCIDHSIIVDLYKDFDSFILGDFDAVILANYADEHCSYAIKSLKMGKHVLSEVLPAANLHECVELIEAVEESDKIYYYGENYCFFEISREMKRLCEKGLLGTIEYAEGEYIHNCESWWPELTKGRRNHWRNIKNAFFYCTHSIGPIIHATKLRPVSVTGFEPPYNDKMRRMGALSAPYAVEMITLENGAIFKSMHGELQKDSIWFSLYGSLGRIESPRFCTKENIQNVFTSLDINPLETSCDVDKYIPYGKHNDIECGGLHERADVYLLDDFIATIRNEENSHINVYEAMDMFLPGIFAYKSVLEGGIPKKIPNFRLKEEREKYREDRSCVEENLAKNQVIPSYSKGNATIPDFIYDEIKKKIKSEEKI